MAGWEVGASDATIMRLYRGWSRGEEDVGRETIGDGVIVTKDVGGDDRKTLL